MSHRKLKSIRRQERRRLLIEPLENRNLLAAHFYWADGVQVELVQKSDQFAIKVLGEDNTKLLSSLTATDGVLADYKADVNISEGVWLLEKSSPIGPFKTPGFDTSKFASKEIEWIVNTFETASSGSRVVIIDELIVGLGLGVESSSFFANLRGEFGDFEYRPLLGTPDQFVVTLSGRSGIETLEIANQLASKSNVTYAAPNTYQDVRRFFTPNDPLYANQWHLNNSGTQVVDAIAGADVNAAAAWDLSTGVGVTIAVIDDGMERTHPDLINNIFINPGEIAGNGIDDDGNGYIDDVSGWSFTTNSPNPNVGSNDEHGTAVAGVAAGRGNNNLGVTGAAFNSKILPVQIFNGATFVGDAGAASAVYYAAGRTANGLGTWNAAQIINCSWGGGSPSTAITAAFTWASNTARAGRGVASFISSGNDYEPTVSYPANLSSTLTGVMAVGATNQRDLRSEYSNYGSALDFVTPSSDINAPFTVGITTTDRSGSFGYNSGDYTNNTVFNGFGGTSSAAPLAAGVGALVLSAAPTMTASQLRATLRGTADKVGGVTYTSGFNVEYGYGRLDAFAALSSLAFRVLSSTPASGSTISTLPNPTGGYIVNFSNPINPTPSNIDLSKVSVNGVSPSSFTVIDADTLQFNFSSSPITTNGNYTFTLAAGAVKRLSNGELLSSFSSSFIYDTVVLRAISTSPVANSVITLPGPFTIDFNFNEPINPSSVSVDDLSLNFGSVVSAVALDADSARYTVSGINSEGVLNAVLGIGKVRDLFNLANPSPLAANFTLDFATVAYPALVPSIQSGSLVASASNTRNISFVGDSDNYTIAIDPGQTVSIVVTPTSSTTLRPRVELFNSANVSQAFAVAPAAGQIAGIQTQAITIGGTYRIAITGDSNTVGGYQIEVRLNAAYEQEGRVIGSTNNTAATAQDVNSSFINLATSVSSTPKRGAVVGSAESAFAGFTALPVTPTFTDISLTGTRSTTAIGDDAIQSLTSTELAGFVFPFYGTNYNSLSFSTNGLITFGGASTAFSNGDLSTTPSSATIAALWNDLIIENTGTGTASRAIFWQVVGTGSNQQFIVQWNNVRPLGGSVYFTLQAVLSRNGIIQINYTPSVVSSVVTSATVGMKAPGTLNPSRLLVHLNQAASTLVGPNLSTRFTPLGLLGDFYRMSFDAGDRVSLALSNLATGNVDVQLIGTDGTTVLANGISGSTNLNESIQNFSITSTGNYFARVITNNPTAVPYSLTILENAVFDAEPNNSFTTAQPTTSSRGALGAITASSDVDWYSIDVSTAGFEIRLETRTPGDGPGEFVNLFNPHIELYSPANVLIAVGSNLADGRNEAISSIASVPGTYRVRVNGDNSSTGQYFVGINATPVSTAPVVTLPTAPVTYVENALPLAIFTGATVTDVNTPILNGGVLTITNTNGEANDRLTIVSSSFVAVSGNTISVSGQVIGTFTGGAGTTPLVVTFNSQGSLNRVAAVLSLVRFSSISNAPTGVSRIVSVRLTDGAGGTSTTVNRTVGVTPVNDAPVLTLPTTPVAYVENAAPLAIFTSANVTDADTPILTGGVLTITNTNGDLNDRLSIVSSAFVIVSGNSILVGGQVVGTFTGGIGTTPLVVTFTNQASLNRVVAILSLIRFSNVSNAPSGVSRIISARVTDGSGGTSAIVNRTVGVTPVNDAPVISAIGPAVTFTRNGPRVLVFSSTSTITDLDNTVLTGGRLTIANTNGQATDSLAVVPNASITVSGANVSYNGSVIGTFTGGVGTTPLVFTFNNQATPARIRLVLLSVGFLNSSTTPSTTPRTISVQITDGFGGTSALQSKLVNVV